MLKLLHFYPFRFYQLSLIIPQTDKSFIYKTLQNKFHFYPSINTVKIFHKSKNFLQLNVKTQQIFGKMSKFTEGMQRLKYSKVLKGISKDLRLVHTST